MLNLGVNPCSISLYILSIIYPLLFIILILVSPWLPYWHPNYIFVLEKSHIFKCLKAAKLHLRKHCYLGEETNTHKKFGTLPKIVSSLHRFHTQINKIHRGRKVGGDNKFYHNSLGSVLRIRDLNNCWWRKLFFYCGNMCSAFLTSCRYLCSVFDLLLMFIEAKHGKRW